MTDDLQARLDNLQRKLDINGELDEPATRWLLALVGRLEQRIQQLEGENERLLDLIDRERNRG